MITLGIESTAHTLGIGICKDGKILSNAMDTYKPKKEGIIPRKAADHHSQVFGDILKEAMEKAGVGWKDIDLIAFAQGPGIGAPLSVGVVAAKFLASYHKKKIIGVNHAYAHMKISEHLTKIKDPLYVYVSGGNTQIAIEEGFANIHILGETLDIGIGNLFDSLGRAMGLEYAHGSTVAKMAEKGKYIELPYSVKGMNLVFSGLLTAAERALKENKKEDVAFSTLETAFAMLCEVSERALLLTQKKGIVVCGGVAQNKRLQEMLKIVAEENNKKFGVAPDEFNRDNGGMIAYTGEIIYKHFGSRKIKHWKAIPRYRIERMLEIYKK